MKEADINFGALYLIEYEGEKRCARITSKLAPDPGRQRSRTYKFEYPDGSTPYSNTVDASKIICTWAEYEKTPEYAEKHARQVREHLDKQVVAAMTEWWELLQQFVSSLVGGRANGAYLNYETRQATSVEEFRNSVGKMHISLPLETLIQLADMPLPPMDGVKVAMETRDEINAQLNVARLPQVEAMIRDQIDVYGPSYGVPMMREYVEALRSSQVDGPHDPLLIVARLNPRDSMLKTLSQEEQFAYLVPLLDWQ